MVRSAFEAANRHSLHCFLNSLFKEWKNFNLNVEQSRIEISLNDDTQILVPLKKISSLGCHSYGDVIEKVQNGKKAPITFSELVYALTALLAEEYDTNAAQLETFRNRVFDSLDTIHESLSVRARDLAELYQPHLNYRHAEQSLMVGHNFHPTPKSRDEFSLDDLKKYSPEMAAHFKLHWFMIRPDLVYQESAASFTDTAWAIETLKTEFKDSARYTKFLNEGYVPVPAHPWQVDHLLKNADLQQYQKQGRLILLGASDFDWYPTSSLRTLYREEARYMIKFSMSVRLTNSVRHMLVHEVVRGLQLQDVMATVVGKEFLAEYPQFSVVGEPAFLAIKDAHGKPLAESIVLLRENPFQSQHQENIAVLAALTQDHPFHPNGPNLIQAMLDRYQISPQAWFEKYLDVAVRPLVMAQANFGVILGAHQQNLILEFKEGYPVHSYFRDGQGTGYSELGFSLFAQDVKSISRENGNVVTEAMGNQLFSYYLILNSTFNVISALAQAGKVTESELLSTLSRFLEAIRSQRVKDPSCLNYLLNETHLMHKGNFLCSFKNINENTTADPLSIYTPIINPLRTSS